MAARAQSSKRNLVDGDLVHPAMLQAIEEIETADYRNGTTAYLLGYSVGRFWALYLCLLCSLILALIYAQEQALYFVLVVVILGLLLALNGRKGQLPKHRAGAHEIAVVLEKQSPRDRLMHAYGESLLALMDADLEGDEQRQVAGELSSLMTGGRKIESHQNLMRRATLGIADLHSLEKEFSNAKERCRLASDELAKQAWTETMGALEKRIEIRQSYSKHAERLDAQFELIVQRLKTFKDLLVRSSISPYVDLHTAISESSASVKDLLADIDANERAVLELIS